MAMDGDRLAQLEEQIRSGSLFDCKLALDELAQGPSELVVPMLQRLLTGQDVLRRRFAVMGLGNHQTDDSFRVLTMLLEQEADHNVLAEAANSIFEFGEVAVPLLQELFHRNHNWLVRQTILSIMMEANDDEVLLDLIHAGLDDETQTVKEAAILAMGSVLKGPCHDRAVDVLATLSESSNWRDRWRAATTLCLASGERARDLLAKLKTDENHYVVAAALESNVAE